MIRHREFLQEVSSPSQLLQSAHIGGAYHPRGMLIPVSTRFMMPVDLGHIFIVSVGTICVIHRIGAVDPVSSIDSAVDRHCRR